MDERELFVLAERRRPGRRRIRDDQWDLPVPDWFQTLGDRSWTLREILAYHAYDDAWVPDMLAGRTMDEAGRDRFDGDLLGGDPIGDFTTIVATACSAARDLALVIGAPVDLPADLVQGMWDGLVPRADEWRGYGVFPAPCRSRTTLRCSTMRPVGAVTMVGRRRYPG